jgi:hypothetical protein
VDGGRGLREANGVEVSGLGGEGGRGGGGGGAMVVVVEGIFNDACVVSMAFPSTI